MANVLEGSVSAKPFERLANHHLVSSWFGCWPSFHDGEVHRITLDRTGNLAPSLELDLRGWLLTKSGSGELVQSKVALVSFRFEGISDLNLEGFNGQNVITALHVTEVERGAQLNIELEHCYQFACSFKAQSGKVVALRIVEQS
ncbi:Imm50 family immunity protein [Roseateles sp. BYS96W]|uniref:Imm50 family immunity protein n=1 Tax=Pelomonas nitida TaxID=3299027 RepID=A0ABW7G270_9BURK